MHALIALAAEEPHAELFLPPWAFPLIVAIAFVVLGFVSWSFRDVSNRHADREPFPAEPHDHADQHH
jgi:hypothetical protein